MSKPVFEDLFRFAGRRNRLSFFLVGLAQIAGLAIVCGVVVAAAATGSDVVLAGALLVGAVPFIAICVSAWAVAGQRCRDFGWTGWAALIALLPYVGWIFAIALCFIPGTDGYNRYGPDPLCVVGSRRVGGGIRVQHRADGSDPLRQPLKPLAFAAITRPAGD